MHFRILSALLAIASAVWAQEPVHQREGLRFDASGISPWLDPTLQLRLPASESVQFDAQPGTICVSINHCAERVTARGVWRGIDAVLYEGPEGAEYDFVVAPGADPSQIILRFHGASQILVDARGRLRVEGTAGVWIHHAPVAYQGASARFGTRVSVAFEQVSDSEVRFRIGEYDHSRLLVIDPVVQYVTRVTEQAAGKVRAVAGFPGGGSVMAGETTFGKLRQGRLNGTTALNGERVPYLARTNFAGRLLWASYFGGAGDEISAVSVDARGHIHAVGSTNSARFPVSPDAPQPQYGGNGDAFYLEVDAEGNMVRSTFLGDSGEDRAKAILLGETGGVTVVGVTSSREHRLAEGKTNHGATDGFIFEWAGNKTRWSFVGGPGADEILGVAGEGNQTWLAGSSAAGITLDGGRVSSSGGFLALWEEAVTKLWGDESIGSVSHPVVDSNGRLWGLAHDAKGLRAIRFEVTSSGEIVIGQALSRRGVRPDGTSLATDGEGRIYLLENGVAGKKVDVQAPASVPLVLSAWGANTLAPIYEVTPAQLVRDAEAAFSVDEFGAVTLGWESRAQELGSAARETKVETGAVISRISEPQSTFNPSQKATSERLANSCPSQVVRYFGLALFPISGGQASIQVSVPANCAWTASSSSPWISIVGQRSFSGSGTVSVSIASSSSAEKSYDPRDGQLLIAGSQVRISQLVPLPPLPQGAAGGSSGLPPGSVGLLGFTAPDPCSPKVVSDSQRIYQSSARQDAISVSIPPASGNYTCKAQFGPPQVDSGWLRYSYTTFSTSGSQTFSIDANDVPQERLSGMLVRVVKLFRNDPYADASYLTVPIVQEAGQPPCTYTVGQPVLEFPAAAESRVANITPSRSNCSWTAGPPPDWATISKISNTELLITAKANTSTQSRVSTLSLFGDAQQTLQPLTLTQVGVECQIRLSDNSRSLDSRATIFQANFTLNGTGCGWSASLQSERPWLSLVGGTSGTGNGSVTIQVSNNSSAASRTGSVLINGLPFTVTQAGIACTVEPNVRTLEASGAGSSGFIDVTTSAPDCGWTLRANAAWIGINPNPLTASGSRRIPVTIASYTDSVTRTSTLTLTNTATSLQIPIAVNQFGVEPVIVDPNIVFTVDPNPIRTCAENGLGKTRFSWTVPPNLGNVKLRISTPTGVAFHEGPPTGEMTTDAWVADGTPFFLQQASTDRALAQLRVAVQCTEGQNKIKLVSSSLTAAPAALIGQPTLYASAVVRNAGSVASVQAQYTYFLRPLSGEGPDIPTGWGCRVDPIAAGATASCGGLIGSPTDLASGDYRLVGVIDPERELQERSNESESVSEPIRMTTRREELPDLVVTDLTFSGPDGGRLTNLKVTVLNRGPIRSAPADVAFYLGQPENTVATGQSIGRCTLPAASTGATASCQLDAAVLPATVGAGEYGVAAVVDPNALYVFLSIQRPTISKRLRIVGSAGNPMELTSSVPINVVLPARPQPVLFTGAASYLIRVPAGQQRLDVTTTSTSLQSDVDLYVRRGAEVSLRNDGVVLADWESIGETSHERISIDNPTAGLYYISLLNYRTDTEAAIRLVASLVSPGSGCAISFDPPLLVLPQGGVSSASFNLFVPPNCSWELVSESSSTWLTVNPPRNGTGTARITVQANTNPVFSARSADVTVTAGSATAPRRSQAVYTISQNGTASGGGGGNSLPPLSAAGSGLVSGQPLNVTLGPRSSPTFFPNGGYFEVPTGSTNVRLTLSSSSSADVDLYVRRGSPPGFITGGGFLADYVSDGPISSEMITIPNPTPGTYYFAYTLWTPNTAVSFRLDLNLTGTVPGTPGGGGSGTGNSCVTQMDPLSTTLSSSGGLGSFTVRTSRSDCVWRATSSQSWVQIITAMPAGGPQTVFFQVPALTGSTRSASVTIDGTTLAHQVTQSAPRTNGKPSIEQRNRVKSGTAILIDDSPAIKNYPVRPRPEN